MSAPGWRVLMQILPASDSYHRSAPCCTSSLPNIQDRFPKMSTPRKHPRSPFLPQICLAELAGLVTALSALYAWHTDSPPPNHALAVSGLCVLGSLVSLAKTEFLARTTSTGDKIMALGYGVGGGLAAWVIQGRAPLWAPVQQQSSAAALVGPVLAALARPGATPRSLGLAGLRLTLAGASGVAGALLLLPALRFAAAFRLQRSPPAWAGGNIPTNLVKKTRLGLQFLGPLAASMLWVRGRAGLVCLQSPGRPAVWPSVCVVCVVEGVDKVCVGCDMSSVGPCPDGCSPSQPLFLSMAPWPSPVQQQPPSPLLSPPNIPQGSLRADILFDVTPSGARLIQGAALAAVGLLGLSNTRLLMQRYLDTGLLGWHVLKHPAPGGLTHRGLRLELVRAKLALVSGLAGRAAVQAAAPAALFLGLGLAQLNSGLNPRLVPGVDANRVLDAGLGFLAWWCGAAHFLFVASHMWVFDAPVA